MKSSYRCVQLQSHSEVEIPPKSAIKSNSENMDEDIQSPEVSEQSNFSTSSKNTIVEIRIEGGLATFTTEQKEKLIRKLAFELDCPLDYLKLLPVRKGSIILRVEMPTEVAERLISLYEINDPKVKTMGIEQIDVIHEQSSLENDGPLNAPKQNRVGKPSATARVSGETSMKTLVEYMVKAVVNNPDSVIVREIEGSNTTIFELSVASEDMGRVIGKQGRVANAMRTLLQVAAVKAGKRVTLEIV